ncbi:hypothetical protein V1481_10510 [Aeromonas enteropelogenes]|uniref:hypothetical protein n=1 Tax=Aeromonas enteropelogenes TaxID=29489 RepID=UPI0031373B81
MKKYFFYTYISFPFFVSIYLFSWSVHKNNLDIISIMGTWLGSIGTVGTLFFLSYQYLNEKEERKNNEKMQADMWMEQRESLNFQKYQVHRELFYKLLENIELDSKTPIKFNNKHELYRRIFPQNNFSKCDYDLSKTESKNILTLEVDVILSQCEEIYRALSMREEHDISCLLSYHKDIVELLDITILPESKTGDVIYFDSMCFNISTPYKWIFIFLEIINKIKCFANLPPRMLKLHGYRINVEIMLLDFFLSREHAQKDKNLIINSGNLNILKIKNIFYKAFLKKREENSIENEVMSCLYEIIPRLRDEDENEMKETLSLVEEKIERLYFEKNHDSNIDLDISNLYNKIRFEISSL